jgi:hypothetical protein
MARQSMPTPPGDSFVDDTTTGATQNDCKSAPTALEVTELTPHEEALVAHMETIIQFFLDLLQVTGGDSAPQKYAWYVISQWW